MTFLQNSWRFGYDQNYIAEWMKIEFSMNGSAQHVFQARIDIKIPRDYTYMMCMI